MSIYYDVTVHRRDVAGGDVAEVFSTYGRSEASGFIDGRVEQPGLLALNMYASQCTRGPLAVGHGAGVLANADGGLDRYLGYALDGCAYSVQRRGDALEPTVFSGRVEQCAVDEHSVTLYLRDRIDDFSKNALPVKFDPDNEFIIGPLGVNGTANDIKGLPKPMVLGAVKNISPICVNTSQLTYQADGQQGFNAGWSIVVYDKRAPLAAGAEYASLSELYTTAPAVGQYRVWAAGGMFRLGAMPAGQITCDVTNPVDVSMLTVTPTPATGCEVHALMARLMYLAGDSTAVLGASLAAVPDCGIYLSQDTSYLDAINQLAQSVGISWGGSAGSLLQLSEPSSLSPMHEHDTSTIIGGLQRIVSGDEDRGLPAWRVNVKYAKNYRTMGETDLAGVALSELAEWTQEFRTASAEDASVKTQWPKAPEITVYTLILTEAAAQAEAARLLALYGVRRDMLGYSVPDTEASAISLGDRVDLTYPRFGLAAGKAFQVIGLQPNFEKRAVQLTVWG